MCDGTPCDAMCFDVRSCKVMWCDAMGRDQRDVMSCDSMWCEEVRCDVRICEVVVQCGLMWWIWKKMCCELLRGHVTAKQFETSPTRQDGGIEWWFQQTFTVAKWFGSLKLPLFYPHPGGFRGFLGWGAAVERKGGLRESAEELLRRCFNMGCGSVQNETLNHWILQNWCAVDSKFNI